VTVSNGTLTVHRQVRRERARSELLTVCLVHTNGVLPITVFLRDRSSVTTSLFGCLIRKVVAMLAEIFMLRLEAKARLVEEVLPSSTSVFVPLSPRRRFSFKQPDLKGEEAPNEEQSAKVVR
jgi:hypothetical protein